MPDAREMLEDAPCGFLQADDEGLILWANRTLYHWLGLPPGQLAGKKRLQDLLTVGGRIFHQTHWAPLLHMQGSVSEVKLEFVRSDGQTLPVIVNAVRRNRDGRPLQEVAVYVARDRDKYEHELLASRRRLQEALEDAQHLRDEAKDRASFAEQMVGIVSHDLRNPLSVIHMSAILLERIGASTDQQKVIERIKRATDRANRLISELLDFTQARLGGGIRVSPSPLAMGTFLQEAVDELRAAFPNHLLHHEHQGPDVECEVDADRLAQVVGNLVSNAADYGDAAKPVTVRSGTSGGAFTISVHNFGPPIPQHAMSRIFLPLMRGEGAAASGRSVGLGLYIVSEIARAHHGHVTVASSEAGGTQFTVTLPCKEPASP